MLAKMMKIDDNNFGQMQATMILIHHASIRCIPYYNTAVCSPFMGALKPNSNGPLYINTVSGTLAADGWAVTFGTAWAGCGKTQSPPRCIPNVTANPSTASVPSSLSFDVALLLLHSKGCWLGCQKRTDVKSHIGLHDVKFLQPDANG